MEENEKKVVIDMHKHGFETGEYEKANLTAKQYLLSNLALASINNCHFVINCGGHDSTLWGREVWELYKAHPEFKKDLTIIPQSEFNVDIGEILTYKDPVHKDTKYVFKKMHMLAAAKKEREEDFFEKTKVYSTWTDMYIRANVNNFVYCGQFPKSEEELEKDYINIGEMMKAARNILSDKYCPDSKDRIPFDIYQDTLQLGLSYTEIRERFLKDSFKYLLSRGLIKNTEKDYIQLSEDIKRKKNLKDGTYKYESIFPKFTLDDLKNAKKSKNPRGSLPQRVEHSHSRLLLKDVPILFGDTACYCVAHPNKIAIRKNTGIPVSAFNGVDISKLSKDVRCEILKKLLRYKDTNFDYFFINGDSTDVIHRIETGKKENVINSDISGVVLHEIILKSLDKYTKKLGYTIDAFEISPWMMTSKNEFNKNQKIAWDHYYMYVKHKKAINCNSHLGDMHMTKRKDLALIDKDKSYLPGQRKYFDQSTYVCTKCSWIDLINDGKFDCNKNELEIRVLNDRFGKIKPKNNDSTSKNDKNEASEEIME